MILTDLSLKRPVFGISLSLIIVLVGLMSFNQLSLQHYPEVDDPTLTVETRYRGASPYVVESKITTILEERLGSVPGLDVMESESEDGTSKITLRFREGTSTQDAAADVREAISQVKDQLPEGVKEPAVNKSDTNQRFFMSLVFQSDKHDALEVYDTVERNVKRHLESIPGVANCDLYGNPYTMQVRIDRDKLTAFNLTVSDVLGTIQTSSQDAPAGDIIKGGRHVSLMTTSALNSPEEMGGLVLKNEGGHIVYLKDVADITLGSDDSNFAWEPRFNGKDAVFAGLNKASGGNMLTISKAVINLLPSIQEQLPEGMTVKLGYDFSLFIKASLKAVQWTIVEAVILVLLIIFFFLRSARASLIPLVTIPISLIGSCAFLYALNGSLNTITLLAMVMAIGLVVDDAIVVLENIHRHIEEGESPMEAAFKGSREVGFAVIAMTLTLASVYAPVAFIQGLTGQLFAEFAIALAGSVLVSGIVALTLSPLMCGKLLKSHEESPPWALKIEGWLKTVDRVYLHLLKLVFAYPKSVGGSLVAVALSCGILFTLLRTELAPQEDQGIVMSWTQGPQGATLEAMKEYTKEVEDIFASIPEREATWTATMRSGVFGGMTLKDWKERSRSQSDVITEVRGEARQIAGAQMFAFPMETILSGGQGGIKIAVKTTGSFDQLEDVMDGIIKKLKDSGSFESVSHNLLLGTPQINVKIDRAKAALAHVQIKDISDTLEAMLGGKNPGTFEMRGNHYDVIVQSEKSAKQGFDTIQDFYVRSEGGLEGSKLVPLRDFVTLEEVAVPSEVKHYNKMRSALIEAELNPGKDLKAGLSQIAQTLQTSLPGNMQWEYAGHMREFFSSSSSLYLIFGAALLFIYLVLAIQFNSFVDPLLILMTVPLSMTGALLALYLTGCSLNIFSQVGLITLIGLITKHGILIVEFANKAMVGGLPARDAVIKAATLRLRPILMTTGAMVLGAVPLALASGAGSESRQQIGWVLVGGLLLGTCLTVFVIPFIYTFVKTSLKSKKQN